MVDRNSESPRLRNSRRHDLSETIEIILGLPARRAVDPAELRSFGGLDRPVTKRDLKLALLEAEVKGLKIDAELRRIVDKQDIKKLGRQLRELRIKFKVVPEGTLNEKRPAYRQDEVAKLLGLKSTRQIRNYIKQKKLTPTSRKGWVLNNSKLLTLWLRMTLPKDGKDYPGYSKPSR